MNGLNKEHRRVAQANQDGNSPPVSGVECRFRRRRAWKCAAAFCAVAAAYRQTGHPYAN